jgi:hypothetical protein
MKEILRRSSAMKLVADKKLRYSRPSRRSVPAA